MSLLKKTTFTIDDIFSLPDGQRAELIDGVIFDMAAPSRLHQRIITKVSSRVDQYITAEGGNCEVYVSPFAVILDQDEDTYVEPDLCVICDPARLSERGCEGAPDWVVEVVSKSSRELDYYIKLVKYCAAGVRVYWIVDPLERMVRVYNFANEDETADFSFDENIPVFLYPDFSLRISDYV